jgi:hypothetical protein
LRGVGLWKSGGTTKDTKDRKDNPMGEGLFDRCQLRGEKDSTWALRLPTVIEYIANQRAHHAAETFDDEFRLLLEKHGLVFTPAQP